MKYRIITIIILFLLDIFIVPWILKLPDAIHASPSVLKAIGEVKSNFLNRPFSGPLFLIKDLFVRQLWYWVQLLLVALSMYILFLPGRLRFKDGVAEGPPSAGRGEYGTSRWQRNSEVATNFFKWNVENDVVKSGMVIGSEKGFKKFTAWLDTDDTHRLIIGATRSGKTRRLIVPTIWSMARAGTSMIITDPKKELYYIAKDCLERFGYKVYCIDFNNPAVSNRWNIIYPVLKALEKGDEAGAIKAANSIAHMITYQYQDPENYKGDKIWPQGETSLIAAVILAVAIEATEKEARHMGSVYSMIRRLGREGGGDLDSYFEQLHYDHPANVAYGVAAMAEERLKNGIFTGAASNLFLWNDPGVCMMTADQDFELDEPGREKVATFIVIPDEDSVVHVLASLFIDQTYKSLTDLARKNGNVLKQPVEFLLEEAGNLPPIPGFAKKITLAAGRNMRFTLAVQGLDQLDKTYKGDSKTIRGNCATWVYLSTSDPDTAKIISNRTGPYTQQVDSVSSQLRKTEYSHGLSMGLSGRPLIMPDEIMRWPVGKALVLKARQYPTKLPLADISMWPIKHLNFNWGGVELEQQNKVVKPPVWVPEVLQKPKGVKGRKVTRKNVMREMN